MRIRSFVGLRLIWGGCGLAILLSIGCERSERGSVTRNKENAAPSESPAEGNAAADADLQALVAELESLEGATVRRDGERLVHLDLRGVVDVDDTIVIRIAGLSDLRNLQLQGESITDASMPAIGQLEQLAALTLQKTSVSDNGLKSIEGLKNLKEVSLYGSPISDAGLESLAKLPRLAKLRLRATDVTGENPAPFAEMQAMVDLELSEIDLVNKALGPIGQIEGLEKLNLWLTKVDDQGVARLEQLDGLTVLNLDNVSGVTDRSLEVIGGMSKLNLLHLGGTGVTDAGLPDLYGLKELRTLFLTRTEVTAEGIAALKEAMPWIERLEHDASLGSARNPFTERLGYQPQGVSPGFQGAHRRLTAANAVRLMVFGQSLASRQRGMTPFIIRVGSPLPQVFAAEFL